MSIFNPKTWRHNRTFKPSSSPRVDQGSPRPSSPNPSTHAHPQSPAFAVAQPTPASVPAIVPTPPPSQAHVEDIEMEDGTTPAASPTPPPSHNRTSSLSVPMFQHPSAEPHRKRHSISASSSRSRSPSIVLDNEMAALAALKDHCDRSLAAVVAELAPIPCIGAVTECLTFVFQAVEKSKVNREQWKLLQGRCVMVARIAGAQVMNYGGEHYQGLSQASEMLNQAITHIADRANHWNRMNEAAAFLQYGFISQEIKSLFSDLDACLKLFSYATDVAQNQWIGEFNAVQQEELRRLEQVQRVIQGMDFRLDNMANTQDGLVAKTDEMHAMLKEVMDKNFQKSTMTPRGSCKQFEQSQTSNFLPISSSADNEKVAKKVFRIGMSDKEHVDRYAQRFMRDAKLWATFRCDYTLPFYGIGMEAFEGNQHFQLYMVSPLLMNFDAMTYLKKHRKNPGMKEGILRIITDAAKGLQYLHNREPPVVHSGMRGENVLITDSGGGVLGGFGLTKALQNTTGPEKTPPAVMTGKTEGQRWMAPEMFLDDSPELQTPSDVWSWAMTALEARARFIISGQIPYYHNKQTHTIILDIRLCKIPQRSRYPDFEKYALKPDQMWALLERCWASEPSQRPIIDEVVIALKKMAM
ncbi:Serine/threonine-protein kinase [Ceratobasidium sp. AG-Ba]|nr:Serine/threonine-protein kinase [Ceratobasidium sp. AG-Ba]